jgi:hypothetical protein
MISKQEPEDNIIAKSRKKAIIFYIVLVTAALTSAIASYIYSKFLPPLTSSFFQMLIQVLATLLGFILVVVFYYLGKFDDQKKNSINSIIQVKNEMRQQTKAIDAAVKALKITYGAPIKPERNALEDQVTDLFGSFTQFTLDEFEKITNYVIDDVFGILISFAVGIVLAFLGLFYVDSLHNQTGCWPLLIAVINSSISTLFNFVMFWKHWQQTSDIMYRTYLRLLNQ